MPAPRNQAFTAPVSGRFLERPCSTRQVIPTPTSISRGRSVAKSTRETTSSEAPAGTRYGDLFRVDVGCSLPEPLAIDRVRPGTLRTSILFVQIEKLFLILSPNGTRVAQCGRRLGLAFIGESVEGRLTGVQYPISTTLDQMHSWYIDRIFRHRSVQTLSRMIMEILIQNLAPQIALSFPQG